MLTAMEFDEQRDQVAVEKILRVVFLDPKHPCPALHKLNRQLAEAEAAIEARKKPPEHKGPPIVGEGLVIDEWKKRRERYLAQKQSSLLEVVDLWHACGKLHSIVLNMAFSKKVISMENSNK
ncbi:hypothetical protein HYC85_012137 [Camellia sinensis]|uniref:Uncharacterized protein n=1 Tax=Camellia sinensis TaxID=4442 RepID=A0A7J7HE13_CAMSI|nr:hypothetical protein HYC85_012137 [Camellia sinensis]